MRPPITETDWPSARSRVGERLAYCLLEADDKEWFAEAVRVAKETVRATPDSPPTWYQARAMATYAIALMVEDGVGVALEWAQRARAETAKSVNKRAVRSSARPPLLHPLAARRRRCTKFSPRRDTHWIRPR